MYSIDCEWFDGESETIDGLIRMVQETGADPNYEVLYNGKPTGDILWDLMEDQI